jgi:hypothetical protein
MQRSFLDKKALSWSALRRLELMGRAFESNTWSQSYDFGIYNYNTSFAAGYNVFRNRRKYIFISKSALAL